MRDGDRAKAESPTMYGFKIFLLTTCVSPTSHCPLSMLALSRLWLNVNASPSEPARPASMSV